MPTQRDLTELAQLKIKLDLYKEQYDEKIAAIKKDLEKEGSLVDPGGILALEVKKVHRRDFSVRGVKEALGNYLAPKCIVESVDVKQFDALTKQKGKSTLTEEQLKKCFTTTESSSVNWVGLDVYKGTLVRKLIDKENQNG